MGYSSVLFPVPATEKLSLRFYRAGGSAGNWLAKLVLSVAIVCSHLEYLLGASRVLSVDWRPTARRGGRPFLEEVETAFGGSSGVRSRAMGMLAHYGLVFGGSSHNRIWISLLG